MVNRFNIGGMGLKNCSELVLKPEVLKQAFADVEAFAAAHPDMHFVSGVCTPLCLELSAGPGGYVDSLGLSP